jgi:hypothetical protein
MDTVGERSISGLSALSINKSGSERCWDSQRRASLTTDHADTLRVIFSNNSWIVVIAVASGCIDILYRAKVRHVYVLSQHER